MTTELKKAFERAEQLPAKEQRLIAQLIYDELNWEATFNNSQTQLSNLANEATEEYKKGKTKPLDL